MCFILLFIILPKIFITSHKKITKKWTTSLKDIFNVTKIIALFSVKVRINYRIVTFVIA
jgi:hypothetical protein